MCSSITPPKITKQKKTSSLHTTTKKELQKIYNPLKPLIYHNADITGADFRYTNLTESEFEYAKRKNVKWNYAKFCKTRFTFSKNNDFEGLKNESCTGKYRIDASVYPKVKSQMDKLIDKWEELYQDCRGDSLLESKERKIAWNEPV